MENTTITKETNEKLSSETKLDHKTRETKRSKAPEKWKQNLRKRLRQSGQEYISVNGKLVDKRKVHPGCGSTCRLNCNSRITSEQRLDIHNMFWKLTDDQKNYFYWKYTSRILPKRRRSTSTEETRRGYTFKYRFELEGELQNVCSKFFFATLDISPRRIYYFYDHCYNEEICMPRTDITKGKGRKRMPQMEHRLDEIRAHIRTFKTECKDGSDKLYLPAGMSLCKMYNMYAENVKEPLKQHWYYKVFNQEFKLQFKMSSSNKSPEGNTTLYDVNEKSDETNGVTYLLHNMKASTDALHACNSSDIYIL